MPQNKEPPKFKITVEKIESDKTTKLNEITCDSAICYLGTIVDDGADKIPSLQAENIVVGGDKIVNVLFQMIPNFIGQFVANKKEEPKIIIQ